MRTSLSLIITNVFLAVVLMGCAKKEPITEIPLPITPLVGKSLPKVSGSLSEYIDIPTSSYILDLHDSIPRLTLKIRVIKAKEISSIMASGILLDSTYVTLLDSLNTDISGCVLRPDTNQIKTINKLLETEGVLGELTFLGDKVTEEFKDTLASKAQNFHLNGALGFQLKESDINVLMNQWRSALKEMNEYVVPPAMVPGIFMKAYLDSYHEADRIRRLLEKHTNLMSEEQKKIFDSLNKRTPRSSLI